jgi:hypothetical protein
MMTRNWASGLAVVVADGAMPRVEGRAVEDVTGVGVTGEAGDGAVADGAGVGVTGEGGRVVEEGEGVGAAGGFLPWRVVDGPGVAGVAGFWGDGDATSVSVVFEPGKQA